MNTLGLLLSAYFVCKLAVAGNAEISTGEFHSFSFFFIATQGLNFPSYIERVTVDDVTMFYYDSSMTVEPLCPQWLNTTEGLQQWKNMNDRAKYNNHYLSSALESIVKQFNQTDFSSETNIYQGYSHCNIFPNGTRKAAFTQAFRGKDFFSLDIDRKTYVASVPQAVVYKRQREANTVLLETVVSFYRTTCFERLKMFLEHAPEVRVKKFPEVRLFERAESSSSVLTCHVTGFKPKQVQVEWIGAGLQPVDGEITDVLPNGDGTYQTRRSVIRPREENPEKHSYSCVVQHSSIGGNITKTWVTETRIRMGVLASLVCIVLAVIGCGLVFRQFCRTKSVVI
uniref:Patr class I histocompatibility antigen, CH28 alpha chain-like n=1 Tax=Astyanax mexicanus TaxID=7994 RepID=W5LDR4_ASTMX